MTLLIVFPRRFRLLCLAAAVPLAACCKGPGDFCPFLPTQLQQDAVTAAPPLPGPAVVSPAAAKKPPPRVVDRGESDNESSGGGGYSPPG